MYTICIRYKSPPTRKYLITNTVSDTLYQSYSVSVIFDKRSGQHLAENIMAKICLEEKKIRNGLEKNFLTKNFSIGVKWGEKNDGGVRFWI